MDYKKLSRIADADNFSVKAEGTKEGFEGKSDESRDAYTASSRRINEVTCEAFDKVEESWAEFCNLVLGEGGPTGETPEPWLNKQFLRTWNFVIGEAKLLDAYFKSGGDDKYLDSIYDFLDNYF